MRYKIPRYKLLAYKKKHHQACLEFRYDAALFNKARHNVGILPLVVPWLWRFWLENGYVPELKELVSKLKNSEKHSISGNRTQYTDDEIFVARCYQLRLGFCRELDLAIRLASRDPKCEIWRDDELDTGDGRSDLIYKKNGQELHIAVCHKGNTSERYAQSRKNDKTGENVLKVVAATRVNEIDLASDEDVKSIVSRF